MVSLLEGCHLVKKPLYLWQYDGPLRAVFMPAPLGVTHPMPMTQRVMAQVLLVQGPCHQEACQALA